MKIYKITNKINNKSYIGLTTRSIEERFNQHIYSRYSSNTILAQALKKYGIHNFNVIELDSATSLEELYKKEKYYINKYNTYLNGYNATLGGEGCPTVAVSDEEIIEEYLILKSSDKVAKKFKIGGNTVLRVLKNYNVELFGSGYESTLRVDPKIIIKTYNELKSIKGTARTLNLNEQTVSRKLKENNITLYQFGFSIEDEENIVNEYINSFYSMTQLQNVLGINRKIISRILKKHNVFIDNNRNKIKPIKLYFLENNDELIFSSVEECVSYIIDNDISKSKKPHTVREGIRYSIKNDKPYYNLKFEILKR